MGIPLANVYVFEPPTYYPYGVEKDVEPGPTRRPVPTTRRRPSRSLEKAFALEGARPKKKLPRG
jgi:hypothetical protein